MKTVGLKILKNNLSEYVRLAAGGQTVLITDRGRVVAELVPAGKTRSPEVADAVLSEAVRRGWITPAASPRGGPPPRVPIASLEKILRGLEEDRKDR